MSARQYEQLFTRVCKELNDVESYVTFDPNITSEIAAEIRSVSEVARAHIETLIKNIKDK